MVSIVMEMARWFRAPCKHHKQVGILVLLILTAGCARQETASDWQLDADASALSFVTIKAANIAETHTFRKLTGNVTNSGAAEVRIALDSVDTAIPIRDERMREFLFDTARFPIATVTAAIDMQRILGQAQIAPVTITGSVDMAGSTVPLEMDLAVARVGADRVVVSTRRPVLIQAASLQLVAAVEKLRELAGLDAISQAVPVTFVLVFNKVPSV